MKKLMISAAVLVVAAMVLANTASAVSVTWSAAGTRFLTHPGGTTGIASGDLVKLGILSTTEVNMQGNQNNIAFLDANFNTWTTGLIGDGTGLDGSLTESSAAPGAGFFSTQLYILAYNAATAGAATEVGLFTNPAWVMPAADNLSLTFDLGDAGLQATIGALSTATVTTPGDISGADAAQLHALPAAVPEPSSIMLVCLGVLGMLGLVRRRR